MYIIFRLDTKLYVKTKYDNIQQNVKLKFEEEYGVTVESKLEIDYQAIVRNLKHQYQQETSRFVKMKFEDGIW